MARKIKEKITARSRRQLVLHTINQLYLQISADLQHCILLRDKLVTNVAMRAIMYFNLQCNNVARQVEEKCWPYNRTFKLLFKFLCRVIDRKVPRLLGVSNEQDNGYARAL